MSSRGPNGSAEATTGARPAGMPLGQWLNTKIASPTPVQPAYAPPHPSYAPPQQPSYAPPQPQPYAPPAAQHPQQHPHMPPSIPMPAHAADSLSEIHQRLDGITRQIDQMSQRRAATTGTPPAATTASGLANQLNEAISRLDMRLNNLSQSQPPRPSMPSHPVQSPPVQSPPSQSAPLPHHPAANHDIDHAATEVRQSAAYHSSPPLSPFGMDAAIAEITARRHALNNGGAHAPAPNPFMQYAPAPPLAPAPAPLPPTPAAPPPPPVDLSGIERQLHNLTSQMEALRRPDHLDQSIASFREELAEIRRSLTEALPRQAIDSLENEIRSLGQKIERSRESGGDQETLGGIERALNEIYGAVRSLTPAEQLTGYDTAIQNLSSKIDLLVRAHPDSNIVQQLEDAIAALRNIAANVASNDAIVHMGDHIRALGDKVDHLSQSGGSDMLAALEQRIALLTAAMEGRPVQAAADSSHLERAIGALSERIDRLSVGNDSSGAMAHVEQRIAYLLERLEGSQPSSNGLGRIEEALSDILRHLENERVNLMSATAHAAPAPDTSGLVDTIRREISDVRHSQSATERRTQDTLEALHSTLSHVVDRLAMIEGDLRRVPAAPQPQAMVTAAPYAPPQTIHPELPNPAAAPQMSDVRIPLAQAPAAFQEQPAPSAPMWQQPAQRAPIDPNLPPDFPLEPGARNRGAGDAPASPDAGPVQSPAADGNGQSNFIAAARRAAQAAAAATNEKPGRVTALTEAARSAAAKATAKVTSAGETTNAKPSRIRSFLVGFGVVVVVLGAFKIALTILESQDSAPAQSVEKSVSPSSLAPPPAPTPAPAPVPSPKAEAPAPIPLLTSPSAVERQTFVAPTPASPQPLPEPAIAKLPDVTGSLAEPAAVSAPAPAPVPAITASLSPVSDKIPDAVAGPKLREAAQRGDASAAYEVGARYAEGRGTQVNYEEAIKWYSRAADNGVVLAMFRLGTLIEKGLGTKKDPDAARRYYVQAAERGNAKAMHNLAVLDADGGGRGPNYKAASNWFKKAAERGIADSQYNLGILYARGIGLEQNLAESYKWFSLAASQGDADAGRKRDDIAKRLDQQSLAAAKLAIQTFTPERQPNDAIAVAAPAGGWDAAPTAAPAKRPAAKSPGKTAAR